MSNSSEVLIYLSFLLFLKEAVFQLLLLCCAISCCAIWCKQIFNYVFIIVFTLIFTQYKTPTILRTDISNSETKPTGLDFSYIIKVSIIGTYHKSKYIIGTYYKSKYIIGTNFCASFTERKSFTLHPQISHLSICIFHDSKAKVKQI